MPLCYQQQMYAMLQARPGFVIPVTSAGTHAGGQHPANTCYLFQHHQHSAFTVCFYNCSAYSHGRVSTSSRTGLLFDRLSPVMGTSRGSVPIPLRCSHWPSDSSCPCRVPPDISPSFLLFPLPPHFPEWGIHLHRLTAGFAAVPIQPPDPQVISYWLRFSSVARRRSGVTLRTDPTARSASRGAAGRLTHPPSRHCPDLQAARGFPDSCGLRVVPGIPEQPTLSSFGMLPLWSAGFWCPGFWPSAPARVGLGGEGASLGCGSRLPAVVVLAAHIDGLVHVAV